MHRTRWLVVLAVLWAAADAAAQRPSPAEINLFGNDFPPAESGEAGGVSANPPGPPAPSPADQQTLQFHHGRQLRGELVEVTGNEVAWRRNDASGVLRFPRADVRRVLLVPPERLTNAFGMNSGSTGGAAAALLATVKLPGGDWLRGAITSADGQAFALTLKDGEPLHMDRAQIEWLHFGPKAAPAYGLGEGPMALEGWLASGPPRVEAKDGTLIVHDATWIGRSLATPARFEVAFEVPAESEEGLRLWLQPFNPQPNSYGFGTVQICFGRKALKWLVYHDSTRPNEQALPAESQAESGPVRYRFFYDGPEERVILLRNGREVGNWSLKPKIERVERQQRLPRGLCFDRVDRGKNSPLQFRRLNVLPWDGALPGGHAAAGDQDWLGTVKPPSLGGRLEAVREKELIFSGKTVPISAETFVRFPATPAPMTGAEAKLSLGEQGEVSLKDVRINDGKVRGRAVFTPALELGTKALQAITFGPRAKVAPPAGDLLVFRNGDELSGALVSAVTGAPLRWRLASGQEIDFQTGRIAGVRLTNGEKAEPAGTVELRTGERLRGEIAAFDARQLRWRHPVLGELALDRQQVWRIFPNASQSLRDGGQDPENWLRETPNSKRIISYNRVRPRDESWLMLDGRFILRPRESNGGESALGPVCDLDGQLDRFELRVDLASPGENYGTLNVTLVAPDDAGVSINLASDEMYINVRNPKSPNGGTNRELPFRDKIGENRRTLNLRAFVNGPAGTVDLMLNGHSIGRIGQSAGERLPGVGRCVSVDAYSYNQAQLVISEVTIAPWSGELPRAGNAAPATTLTNGDAAAGAPASLIDGRWQVESEIGPLDLPAGKVQAVEFGGEMQPAKAAGRVRLVDGSALLVERFEWAGGQLTARHAIFGDMQLPANAVRELIYDPAPVRPAMIAEPKKVARKDNETPAPVRP